MVVKNNLLMHYGSMKCNLENSTWTIFKNGLRNLALSQCYREYRKKQKLFNPRDSTDITELDDIFVLNLLKNYK